MLLCNCCENEYDFEVYLCITLVLCLWNDKGICLNVYSIFEENEETRINRSELIEQLLIQEVFPFLIPQLLNFHKWLIILVSKVWNCTFISLSVSCDPLPRNIMLTSSLISIYPPNSLPKGLYYILGLGENGDNPNVACT